MTIENQWATKVLKWVLKHARQQWDHQNDELYRQNPNKVKDLTLNANIHEQYYKIGVNERARPVQTLFCESLEYMFNLP